MKKTTILTLAIGLIPIISADAATIVFGGVGSSPDFSPYSESGFLFTQTAGSGSSISPSEELGVEGTVRITRIDGGLFNLQSLDVVFRNSLDALGTFDLETSNGGIQDLAGVSGYSFSGSGFQGLSWVDLDVVKGEFFSDNNTIDNIVLNPIPEPSSALLLGLGALGMVARRKRTT
jgi:hypothetical protein